MQITLYIFAAYMAVFGMLFLFVPGFAEQITHTTPPNPMLNLLYGQYTVTFAYVAYMAARENKADSKLSLTILILTTGHVLVFGYLLLTGLRGFSEAGPPLIVNLIFTGLLFLFRK